MRLLRHLIAVLAAAIGVALLLPSPVSAHNTLLSSTPADGAVLAASPTEISLQFDLPAPLETASIEIIDVSGVRTDLTGLAFGPAGDTQIVAPLPASLSGAITIRWRLVGPDGHPLTGRIGFEVAATPATTIPTTAAPTATSAPGIDATPPPSTSIDTTSTEVVDNAVDDSAQATSGLLRWVLRFGSYVAIGLVVGIVLTDRLVWPGVAGRANYRRILGRSLGAVAALGFLQLLVVASDITGESMWQSFGALDAATLTDAGFAFVLRILLAGVAWLLLCQMHVVHDEIRWIAITVAGLAMLGTWAWAGHSKSQRWSWLGVPLDIIHHTAAALWIGSLAIVAVTAMQRLDHDALDVVMRRLSSVAATSVGLVAATGVVQTVRLVGSPADLLDVSHGRYLALKLLLLAAMLALANLNRLRVQSTFRTSDRLDTVRIARLRQSVISEFAIGVGIIAVTAAMVVSPPATSRVDAPASVDGTPPGPVEDTTAP